MIRTEVFKLRTHRTPWVLFAVLTASLCVAPAYFAIKNPADTADFTDAYLGVAGIMAPLLGAVFGGWMIGHEFRQGTLRRVLGNDARRGRLIAVKAGIGLVAAILGMSVATGIGALASAASALSFGEAIEWDGVVRNVLGGAAFALVTAAIAFALSILLRNDTYAMLGSLGVMLIVGPLLAVIPRVGKYTPWSLTVDVTTWISGQGELEVSIVPAAVGLVTSIGLLTAAAVAAFHRSDI
ncbi:MAG: ABC transporter permease subunit [Acidimicrobiales bacterium]